MTSDVVANNYISCLGDEDKVAKCRSTCDEGKYICCKTNVTLEVRCNKRGNGCSIVTEVALGAVAFLLLVLLLVSSITSMTLWIKLRRSKQKPRQFESETHHHIEQQLGQ